MSDQPSILQEWKYCTNALCFDILKRDSRLDDLDVFQNGLACVRGIIDTSQTSSVGSSYTRIDLQRMLIYPGVLIATPLHRYCHWVGLHETVYSEKYL